MHIKEFKRLFLSDTTKCAEFYDGLKTKIMNDPLNAFAYVRIDEAINEVKALDFNHKPYAGIPFVLKNLGQELIGTHNSSSSPLLKDYVSAHTDTIVQKLLDVGFVVIGQTNTPEFGFDNLTYGKMFGIVKNAVNPAYHSGGSSGGAASALKAGYVPFALASDGGGSIRIPASYQALVGLKPTRGRIVTGPYVFDAWQGASTHFALTTNVSDTILLLDLLTEYVPQSKFALPNPEKPFAETVKNLKGKKFTIAYTTKSPAPYVDSDAVLALNDLKPKLQNLGHTLVEDFPRYDKARLIESYYLMNAYEAYHFLKKVKTPLLFSDVEPLTYLLYTVGKDVTTSDLEKALSYWDEVSKIMNEFHQKYDLLLTPTTNGVAPLLGTEKVTKQYFVAIENSLKLSFQERFALLKKVFAHSLMRTPYTQLPNLTGQPAISVPTFKNALGLPLGMQFIAAHEREDYLLTISKELEDNDLFVL